MPTLNHPRIPHVTVDVPDSDVEQWQASGWLPGEPAPAPVFDEGGTLEPVCDDHKPVQHRDGKPPWCDGCGLTASGEEPVSKQLEQ